MHRLFAIEPEAISNWKDFRYVIEKFGYSKGTVIACFPGKWPKLVIDACRKNGVGDMEFTRIVEKLRQAKSDRLCNLGLQYDRDFGWLDNAINGVVSDQLDAILVREVNCKHKKLHAVADMDENLFAGCSETAVPRDAESLASTAQALIRKSRTLVLIDPYFRSKKPCLNVLQSLLGVVEDVGKQGCEIVIHTAYSTYSVPNEQYVSESQRWLAEYKNGDISVRVARWSDGSLDFDLHARYLLSEHGGLRYDRGFEEPHDHDKRAMTTDVICMDRQRKYEVEMQFADFETNERVHDIIELL